MLALQKNHLKTLISHFSEHQKCHWIYVYEAERWVIIITYEIIVIWNYKRFLYTDFWIDFSWPRLSSFFSSAQNLKSKSITPKAKQDQGFCYRDGGYPPDPGPDKKYIYFIPFYIVPVLLAFYLYTIRMHLMIFFSHKRRSK